METTRRLNWLFASLGIALVMILMQTGDAKAQEGAPTLSSQDTSGAPSKTAVDLVNELFAVQPPLCRYGVTAHGDGDYTWLPTWRSGWWMNYGSQPPAPGIAGDYAGVLWVQQQKNCWTYLDGYTVSPPLTDDGLGAIVRGAPGSLWLVGNEVDRGPNPGETDCTKRVQGDTYPEIYARAYHDIYAFIKQHDPTAMVANSGLVQITPGRLQYLDKVWQAYQQRYGQPMPVDVWNMHLYVLPEAHANGTPNGIANIALGTDPALAMRESTSKAQCEVSHPQVYCWADHDNMTLFDQQITAMRTWMKGHGQQNKPLIISEYSILFPYEIDKGGTCFSMDEFGKCFDPARVNAFMASTFNYFETRTDSALGYPLDGNRLVQRWMWFSAYNEGVGNSSNLVTAAGNALTAVGDHFKNQVAARASTINLFRGQVGGSPGHTGTPGGTATVNLYAQILNGGSISTDTAFTVTFYKDEALTQVIGSQVVSGAVSGCVIRPLTAQTTWANLPVGTHRYWVKIDSTNNIGETNEGDNIGTGTVTVSVYARYLPLVSR